LNGVETPHVRSTAAANILLCHLGKKDDALVIIRQRQLGPELIRGRQRLAGVEIAVGGQRHRCQSGGNPLQGIQWSGQAFRGQQQLRLEFGRSERGSADRLNIDLVDPGAFGRILGEDAQHGGSGTDILRQQGKFELMFLPPLGHLRGEADLPAVAEDEDQFMNPLPLNGAREAVTDIGLQRNLLKNG